MSTIRTTGRQPISILVAHDALKLKDISIGGHVTPPISPALSPFDSGTEVTTLWAGVKLWNTCIAVVGGKAIGFIPRLGYGNGTGIGPTGVGIGVNATSGNAKFSPGKV
jgi:hypothetical protein